MLEQKAGANKPLFYCVWWAALKTSAVTQSNKKCKSLTFYSESPTTKDSLQGSTGLYCLYSMDVFFLNVTFALPCYPSPFSAHPYFIAPIASNLWEKTILYLLTPPSLSLSLSLTPNRVCLEHIATKEHLLSPQGLWALNAEMKFVCHCVSTSHFSLYRRDRKRKYGNEPSLFR